MSRVGSGRVNILNLVVRVESGQEAFQNLASRVGSGGEVNIPHSFRGSGLVS